MFAHGDSIFIGDEVSIANGSQRGALFHYQKVDGVWTSMGFITVDETLEDAWELGREVVVEGSRLYVSGLVYRGAVAIGVIFVFEESNDGWGAIDVVVPPTLEYNPRFGEKFDVQGDVLISLEQDISVVELNGRARLFKASSAGYIWQEDLHVEPNALLMDVEVSEAGFLMATFDIQATKTVHVYPFEPTPQCDENRECICLPGYLDVDCRAPLCGDGVLEGDEQCDEGPVTSAACAGCKISTFACAANCDPLKSQTAYVEQRLDNSTQTMGNLFGSSVAVASGTMAVGARNDAPNGVDTGAVYLYKEVGGTWQPNGVIVPHDGQSGDAFGQALAMERGLLVVGAQFHNSVGPRSGAAYVYVEDDGNWTFVTKLVPQTDAEDTDYSFDLFGGTVAVSGGLIAVGAPSSDEVGGGVGSVHFFVPDGQDWRFEHKFLPPTGRPQSFGAGIAIFEDSVLIGAPFGGGQEGSAYLYRAGSGGDWSMQELTHDEPRRSDRFGWSVALTRDYAFVGAGQRQQVENGDQVGAVFVFDRARGNQNTGTLVSPSVEDGAQFGRHLAASDRLLAVVEQRDRGLFGRGALYVYRENNGEWIYDASTAPNDANTDLTFGTCVALDAEDAVVGASIENQQMVSSAVYHYYIKDTPACDLDGRVFAYRSLWVAVNSRCISI